MFLRSMVDMLNEDFGKVVPGTKVYGIAQSIIRTQGSETELLPGVVNKEGEITYVGIDDTVPVIIYHRHAGLTSSKDTTTKGRGDEDGNLVNTYQMAMIVFIDHKKAKMYPEELFLFLQANFPDAANVKPYQRVMIRMNNAILNSQLVFQAEYSGAAFLLPPEMSLFQINYVIETAFSKGCLSKCPEDC